MRTGGATRRASGSTRTRCRTGVWVCPTPPTSCERHSREHRSRPRVDRRGVHARRRDRLWLVGRGDDQAPQARLADRRHCLRCPRTCAVHRRDLDGGADVSRPTYVVQGATRGPKAWHTPRTESEPFEFEEEAWEAAFEHAEYLAGVYHGYVVHEEDCYEVLDSLERLRYRVTVSKREEN